MKEQKKSVASSSLWSVSKSAKSALHMSAADQRYKETTKNVYLGGSRLGKKTCSKADRHTHGARRHWAQPYGTAFPAPQLETFSVSEHVAKALMHKKPHRRRTFYRMATSPCRITEHKIHILSRHPARPQTKHTFTSRASIVEVKPRGSIGSGP